MDTVANRSLPPNDPLTCRRGWRAVEPRKAVTPRRSAEAGGLAMKEHPRRGAPHTPPRTAGAPKDEKPSSHSERAQRLPYWPPHPQSHPEAEGEPSTDRRRQCRTRKSSTDTLSTRRP